jgi:hypothetical protein
MTEEAFGGSEGRVGFLQPSILNGPLKPNHFQEERTMLSPCISIQVFLYKTIFFVMKRCYFFAMKGLLVFCLI